MSGHHRTSPAAGLSITPDLMKFHLHFVLISILNLFIASAYGQDVRVTDVNAGPDGSYPQYLTALDGKLYFWADDTREGGQEYELYVYDPSSGIGQQAAEIVEGESGIPTAVELIPLGGKLYFLQGGTNSNEEIWSFDPASGVVATEVPKIENSGLRVFDLTVLEEELFFIHAFVRPELKVYDPVTRRTNEIATVNTMTIGVCCGEGPRGASLLGAVGRRLYFRAEFPPSGPPSDRRTDLWFYEPATDSAAQAATYSPGLAGDLIGLNGDVYFMNGGSHGDSNNWELWTYDPATGASALAAEMVPGIETSLPRHFATLGGRLYYIAGDGDGERDLWEYDAASGAATSILSLRPASMANNHYYHRPEPMDGRLYFSRHEGDPATTNLWVYEPATGTSSLVTEATYNGSDYAALDGKLYFAGTDSAHGAELWVYDPSSQVEVEPDVTPFAFSLSSHPNPMHDAAVVSLTLPASASTRVEAFDLQGRLVAVLHQGPLAAGTHALRFEMPDLPPGLYFIRVATPTGMQSRAVTVMR